MIRSMSANPLLEDLLPTESLFVGEAYEMRNVRTVYVAAQEDNFNRENRVLLLIGPRSAEKSALIDFLCNFFYGAELHSKKRYRIAGEKFNGAQVDKLINCYIFNNSRMTVRPVIIDTPGTGTELAGEDVPSMLSKWLMDNWKMRLDVIGVVFSDMNRLTQQEEEELHKVLEVIPTHAKKNLVVFVTGNDGTPPLPAILRRFGLQDCRTAKIITSCLLQKIEDDFLKERTRENYWSMTMQSFEGLYDHLVNISPVTISGLPYVNDLIYGLNNSSQSSGSTVIEASTYKSQTPVSTLISRQVETPVLSRMPTELKTSLSSYTFKSSTLRTAELDSKSDYETKMTLPVSEVGEVSRPKAPPPLPPLPSADFASRPPSQPRLPPPPPPPPPPIPPSSSKPPLTPEPRSPQIETTFGVNPNPPAVVPKPPSFSPPSPPRTTSLPENQHPDTSFGSMQQNGTAALTNAMLEHIRTKHLRDEKDEVVVVDYGNSQPEFVVLHNSTGSGASTPRVGVAVHQTVPDTIRGYADERTPSPVVHRNSDNYSTVSFMNNDQYYKTSRSSHTEAKNSISVRDAYRLSREDLRVVDKSQSSPTDSNSDELRRLPSGRSAISVSPRGDINTRYIYDTSQRNYKPYSVQSSQHSSKTTVIAANTENKNWSRTAEPRETVINDSYYDGNDAVHGYGTIEVHRNRGNLSTHGSLPELVHSENRTDVQQKVPLRETTIDYPVVDRRTFSREDQTRRSRHLSEGGGKQIPIERRISPERSGQFVRNSSNRQSILSHYQNVDMSDNPQYRVPNSRPNAPNKNGATVVHRVAGGEVLENEKNSTYNAYSSRHSAHSTGQDVLRQPVPPSPAPVAPLRPRYDEVPQSVTPSNHYIIPTSMRTPGSPIQNQVQVDYDPYGQVGLDRQPVALETTTTTTTTRREEIERRKAKKERENQEKQLRIEEQKQQQYNPYDGESQAHHHGHYGDVESGLLQQEKDHKDNNK